jgi:ATP-dependent DNA ligase
MASFDTLFGEASTGKVKQWSIRVFEKDGSGIIETVHGYKDGKMQTNQKEISEGKNIGKKNETTPLEQAISEAKAAWIKKKESGYSNNIEEDNDSESIDSGRGKGISSDAPSVMLAHDYNKRAKDIKFPCFIQPKLDGTRCVAVPNKGLFSRLKKRFPHMEHIIGEINKLPPSIILDGELYSHELTFQEIVGLVKRETLKKGDEEKQKKIKFHVYDIISDQPYSVRYANLQLLFRRNRFEHLVLVQTDNCDNSSKIPEQHAKYVEDGYEGLMLRNKDGLYKGVRSKDLQKFKCFEDAEYKIVDYTCGKGLEDGCVIWECETKTGQRFTCRPRGTREDREEYFINGDKYIGKMLTIRYQELTNDGLPRFGVGIAIRDYE